MATAAAAAARVMRVGSMVRRPVSHACDARALEYVIRWQQVSMAEVVTQQSAAVRRLAALMQRDDDEAEQARQAELEQERQRAAAAQKAAAEHGVDPKTKRQIKYCAGKLAGWLELHGEAAGYDASVGPTVAVMKAFSSHCFSNRKFYSTLSNLGMGASFGALQLPYLVPKYGFPLLQMPGWVGLEEEALETKAAPFKIALRTHWKELTVAHVLTEEERLAEEQQRSLVKVKWDDRALSLAQDQCMRDVLRRNRAATRLVVMAFVRATACRGGGFSRDWADRAGLCLQWVGRNVLSVYDFAWDEAGLYIEMPDSSVVRLRPASCLSVSFACSRLVCACGCGTVG